jgi:hypothetical protein
VTSEVPSEIIRADDAAIAKRTVTGEYSERRNKNTRASPIILTESNIAVFKGSIVHS